MNDVERAQTEMISRAGEQPGNPLVAGRSSRIFRLPNGWYFNTREKIALGPFTSAEAAALGIADFLDFLREAPDHVRRLFRAEQALVA